ncbi:lipopolysaccharide biosynthesis protein [Aeromonas sp. QDB07]|uniref:lipopolysaccharide biosynthesis protein n=1 Tax=Aeromonas sp. QDB07 TaxID=2989838 RepID=UPI0022E4795C|nr:oligosaccharide flippase family protein [Aeromonas sp. QDB07]
MGKLTSNLFYSITAHVIKMILPLLLFPFVARILGAEGLGKFSYYQAITIVIASIVEFGYAYTIVNKIILNPIHEDDYIKEVEVSRTLISILICMVSMFFSFVESDTLILISALTGIFSGSVPVYLYQVKEHFKRLSVLELISLAVYYLISFILLPIVEDVIVVVFSLFISRLITLWWSRRSLKLEFYVVNLTSLKVGLRSIKENFIFFLHRASVVLYSTASVLIVGDIYTLEILGYYSSSEKLVVALCGLCGPIQSVLLPFLSKNKSNKKLKIYFAAAIIVVALFCFVVSSNADLIFSSYYGDAMISGGYYFEFLIWLFPLKLTSCVLSTDLYLSRGNQKAYSAIYIKILAVSIPILYASARYQGVEGMMLALLGVELLLIIIMCAKFMFDRVEYDN